MLKLPLGSEVPHLSNNSVSACGLLSRILESGKNSFPYYDHSLASSSNKPMPLAPLFKGAAERRQPELAEQVFQYDLLQLITIILLI